MGMRAHLIAVDPNEGVLAGDFSDGELSELLWSPEATEIDKSWEAVFPLVGSIAGTGMMLAEEPVPVGGDLGFGPAMFVDPEQTAAISSSLAAADDATVAEHWSRLDSPFMSDGRYEDEWGKDFAMDGYRETAKVFAAAAAASQGVLFAIM